MPRVVSGNLQCLYEKKRLKDLDVEVLYILCSVLFLFYDAVQGYGCSMWSTNSRFLGVPDQGLGPLNS